MPPAEGGGYSRAQDVNILRQEVVEFRKRHYEELQAIRQDTVEWRKQRNEEVLQFRAEVSEIRKAIEVITRMVGTVEQQTLSTKDMAMREQKQMEQVYFLLRGDNEGRGGILGRIAALEYQTKELEVRREEIIKDIHSRIADIHQRRQEAVTRIYERLEDLETNREKASNRVWQIAISAITGSMGALALSRLLAP